MSVMQATVPADQVSGAEALLDKHVNFEQELKDHQQTGDRLDGKGRATMNTMAAQKVDKELENVISSFESTIAQLTTNIQNLASTGSTCKVLLEDNLAMLQYRREADNIESWIVDKTPAVLAKGYGRDVTNVESLLKKNKELDELVKAYQPRIDKFSDTKRKLLQQNNRHASAISKSEGSVIAKWNDLLEIQVQREVFTT